MKKLSHILSDYMVESLKMPKDMVLGNVLMSISGRQEIYIENYRSIIEYTESQVKLQTKNGKVIISGKQLRIEYYTNDEMKVTGTISEIKYD